MSSKKKREVRNELDSHAVDCRLMGDQSESGESRRYLESILGPMKDLKYRIQCARSTPRQKVAEATISVFLARAQSLIQYLACGGEAAPAAIQREIFDPVLNYWDGMYGRDAKDDSDDV